MSNSDQSPKNFDQLEERVRKLENMLAGYRAGILVFATAFAAFFLYVDIKQVPQAVRDRVEASIGTNVLAKVRRLEVELDSFATLEEAAINHLGVVRYDDMVNLELESSPNWLAWHSDHNQIEAAMFKSTTNYLKNDGFFIRRDTNQWDEVAKSFHPSLRETNVNR
jgi:hypothetical protein